MKNEKSMISTLEITMLTILNNYKFSLLPSLYIFCVCAQSFQTPCTRAHEASLSKKFSRQEYWRGLPFLSSGIFPIQGSNPCLLCLLYWKADSLPLCHLGSIIFLEYNCVSGFLL